jgi:hypothetical protein
MKKYYVVSYEYEHNYKWHTTINYYTNEARAKKAYERIKEEVGIYSRAYQEVELTKEEVEHLLQRVKEYFGEECYELNNFSEDYFVMCH